MRRVVCGLIGLALAGSAPAANVYKCTDPATGRTTISQFQCAPEASREAVSVARPSAQAVEESRQRWEAIGAEQDAARLQREVARAEARQREQFEMEQAAIRRQQAEAEQREQRSSRDGGYRYEFGWSNSRHPYRDYRDNPSNQKGQNQRGKDRIHGSGAVRPSMPSVTGGR